MIVSSELNETMTTLPEDKHEAMRTIGCSIGVMAFNEEANIGRILEALLAQETRSVRIDEIVVVASGCTDRTEEIVREYMGRSSCIHLLHQDHREGKASAVNLFLSNVRNEVIVLESADTVPQKHTIEALVSPFLDPKVGMVGGHPVPTNRSDQFMGYGVHMLWELHHQLSLRAPKMGELIAFRNIFQSIPSESAVDEASIEPLILGQGMRLQYAPEAVIHNKGPETLRDFFIQRRRIFTGHLYVKDTLGYRVSSMNGLRIAQLFFSYPERDWRYYLWGPMIAGLEVIVRLLALYDYRVKKRNPHTWKMAETTKDLAGIS